ncbi:MAG: acyl-CoA dehydrogenase [Bacteroidota bacterium]
MQYVSKRNLKFLLSDVLDLKQLKEQAYYSDFDLDLSPLAIDAAQQLGDKYLFPHYRIMDQEKAYYKDGEVKVKAAVGEGMRAMGAGGWLTADWDYDDGGQRMPLVVMNAGKFILLAANGNITAYGGLTSGAANLIRNFATDELKQTYLPKMASGHWQGTMALTEPQAGSSLSDITTTAHKKEDGSYAIKGQKIYISGGDHDSVENVVHLLLARHPEGPAGTKGISLFIVPKYRPEENGELADNHVTTAGIYGKMGQKGYVAAHLMYGEQGETIGYLVGQERRGLANMFQMMNEARIATGLMAASTASAAYYASLQYANERPQGRHPDSKDASSPQITIIEHADVRRMLLFQKSVVEGSIALLLQCSLYQDLAEHADDEATRKDYHLLLELLTPIAKSYPAEYGNLSVSMGMQVLGGAGYCDDFPLEQHYRDIRVNSIYEGTTTIHGLDLMGRKIVMEKGRALELLLKEVMETINITTSPLRQQMEESETTGKIPTRGSLNTSKQLAEQLQTQLQKFGDTLQKLQQVAMEQGPRAYLADASLFLEYFSLYVMAWQWLKQSIAAEKALATAEGEEEMRFYRSKIQTAQYFYAYEFTKAAGLRATLLDGRQVSLNFAAEDFV